MTSESVASRAYRTLKPLKQYRDYTGKKNEDFPHYVQLVSFQPDENLIGIYENITEQAEESILITNLGIFTLINSEWVNIKYEQILKIEVPTGNKNQAKELFIYWNGTKTKLMIRGGTSKFRDLFEFLHFLERVSPHANLT